MFAVFV